MNVLLTWLEEHLFITLRKPCQNLLRIFPVRWYLQKHEHSTLHMCWHSVQKKKYVNEYMKWINVNRTFRVWNQNEFIALDKLVHVNLCIISSTHFRTQHMKQCLCSSRVCSCLLHLRLHRVTCTGDILYRVKTTTISLCANHFDID